MKMKVINEIRVYEINGNDENVEAGTTIKIESHWNNSGLVVLDVFGAEVTVSADALEKAIRNATNVERY